MVYYFYPAHHRFYHETRLISFLKSSFLFLINFIIILFSPIYILYLYQSKITPKWKVLSLFVLATALSCSSAKVTESADNSDPTSFMNTITANELKHIFTL
jgi:hypothetical protein